MPVFGECDLYTLLHDAFSDWCTYSMKNTALRYFIMCFKRNRLKFIPELCLCIFRRNRNQDESMSKLKKQPYVMLVLSGYQ